MRITALFRRWKKRNPQQWLKRWNRACNRCWQILHSGKPTKERFLRFERTHNRLIKLSEQKTKTTKP